MTFQLGLCLLGGFPTGLLVIYCEGGPRQSIRPPADRQPAMRSQTTWTQVLVLLI